ncbi:ATP phosphoribosyltransferase regulatory subunit [Sulfurimonas sp. HSL1-2]|uniref:ATP phosphoribosyltransferase regulatory subunit n=1 Tax=Thiomicrolovo zhangzhouensis TaxID=3131933 RepID=UPI0031F85DA9
MIFAHEIPEGSKLYFGASARRKREIEQIASDVLYADGFEEIVVPLFSHHQHESISDAKELIRLGDRDNNRMSLRADTTIDVVRIISKRLGRNTDHRKWFYIQPVYRYPSHEQYQVGAEVIGEADLSIAMRRCLEIFERLETQPLLQISNINIPKILSRLLDIPMDDFRHIRIENFLARGIDWLTKLVYLEKPSEIDAVLPLVPEELRVELVKMKELSLSVPYANTVVAPLYYAKMLYYDELYFRVIAANDVYARGGRYKNEDVTSVGFAIATDVLLEAGV